MSDHDDRRDHSPAAVPRPPNRGCGCVPGSACGGELDRRAFLSLAGLATAGAAAGATSASGSPSASASAGQAAQLPAYRELLDDPDWPILRIYAPNRVDRVALPLGGIGTGTVSLTGFGSLPDWEIMNRPAKGFTPSAASPPSFTVFVQDGAERICRLAEGPLPVEEYEASHGSRAPNARLPRFGECYFGGSATTTPPGTPTPGTWPSDRLETSPRSRRERRASCGHCSRAICRPR